MSTPDPLFVDPAVQGGFDACADYAGAVSIVIPVKDEADNILPLLEEIHAALDGVAGFELVVVDDGSLDATPFVLEQAAARFPRLRVLRHRRCCGQSAALASGVRAARHAWVVTLDGDRQNDPADIVTLLATLARPRPPRLALAVGWRTSRHGNVLRRLTSQVANGVRSRLLGDGTPDTDCGLKLFSREVFLRVPFFDHMHRFLPVLFLREGAQVVSVPVRHRPRVAGVSKYGIGKRAWIAIVDLLGVMWLQRRTTRPEIDA